jgi:hypothetical protein
MTLIFPLATFVDSVDGFILWLKLIIPLYADDGGRTGTGAAEVEGGLTGSSGSGNLRVLDAGRLLGARTTRADLERMINSSI